MILTANPKTRLLFLGSEGYQSLVTLRELLRLDLAPMAVAPAADTPRAITPSLGNIALDTEPAFGSRLWTRGHGFV
jgi:hypothetical protein